MRFATETPSISKMGHSHSTYSGSDLSTGLISATPFFNTWSGDTTSAMVQGLGQRAFNPAEEQSRYDAALRAQQGLQSYQPSTQKGAQTVTVENVFMGRRLVQVFITDPDEKVPLESCLLYSGQQKMTDLTDTELFFEIDIKSVLETHNAVRAKIVDKAVKERTQYLEPTRVSKLKMVVVDVAKF